MSAAMHESTERQGISEAIATNRGATRNRNGPIPIASIASTSSETCIVPSSAVYAAPILAARTIPVSNGPSSRVKAMEIRVGTKPFGTKFFQLIPGQQRHRQPQKKRNHQNERDRSDAGSIGLREQHGESEWRPSAANVISDFFQRV